jgi:[ribosomal protein S5]-alanine N-acetyltransferase
VSVILLILLRAKNKHLVFFLGFDMYNPYMKGKLVYLRAPTEEDALGCWLEWFSDPDVTRYLIDRQFPNTRELQLEFFESLSQNPSRIALSVVGMKDDRHIGVVSLSGVNWMHGYADIAVVIGDRGCREIAGYGIEAVGLLIRLAFLRFNLLNLRSVHVSGNEATSLMIRLFGFKEAGVIKEFYEIDGILQDSVISCLSKKSWMSRNV